MTISLFGTSKKGRKHGASTSQNSDNSSEAGADMEPTRLRIAQNLRSVIDQEVGLNIVDLGLLHVSLVVRTAGDVGDLFALRQWGGMLNAAAILLFLAVTVSGFPERYRRDRKAR